MNSNLYLSSTGAGSLASEDAKAIGHFNVPSYHCGLTGVIAGGCGLVGAPRDDSFFHEHSPASSEERGPSPGPFASYPSGDPGMPCPPATSALLMPALSGAGMLAPGPAPSSSVFSALALQPQQLYGLGPGLSSTAVATNSYGGPQALSYAWTPDTSARGCGGNGVQPMQGFYGSTEVKMMYEEESYGAAGLLLPSNSPHSVKNRDAQRRFRQRQREAVTTLEARVQQQASQLQSLTREKRMVEQHNEALLKKLRQYEQDAVERQHQMDEALEQQQLQRLADDEPYRPRLCCLCSTGLM